MFARFFGVKPSEISGLAVRDDFWRRLFSEFRRRGFTAITVRKKQSALKKWLDFFGVRGVDRDYVNRVKGQIYGRVACLDSQPLLTLRIKISKSPELFLSWNFGGIRLFKSLLLH